MENIKKLLCLAVIACIVLSLTTISYALPAPPDTSKPVTLQWYTAGAVNKLGEVAVLAEVNKYLKDKLNVTLKLDCIDWPNYEKKMASMVAAKQKFDICFTANWLPQFGFGINAYFGAFVDLTKMIDQYAPKTKQLIGQGGIKGGSVFGKFYGIPNVKQMYTNWILVYRSDIAKELGIDMAGVKSLSELTPILAQVKKAKPAVYPFEPIPGESFGAIGFQKVGYSDIPGALQGRGSPDKKVIDQFEMPEAKVYYGLMRSWYNAGYIRKDADTMKDWQADPKAGKVFCLIQPGSPYRASELSAAWGQQLGQIDLTAPLETTEDAAKSLSCISKTSPNPERALMFLELLNTDSYLKNLLDYGIEGKQYNFTDRSKGIIRMDGNGIKDYSHDMGWEMGNELISYVKDNENPDKWNLLKKYNGMAAQSPILGWAYLDCPYTAQLNAIVKIKQQLFPPIETGKADYQKALPAMILKFRENGLDMILYDMQKKIDAFLKK